MKKSKKPKHFLSVIANIILRSSVLVGAWIFTTTLDVTTAAIATFSMVGFAFLLVLIANELQNRKYIKSGLDVVDKMSGIEFEEFLLAHFNRLGYNVKLTPVTADYGADLIIEKGGIKTAVQAKRWKQKVGVEAVQQIIGAMGYYKTDNAIVVTNSFCSKNAYMLANANNVDIWNRDELRAFMYKTNAKELAIQVKEKTKNTPLFTQINKQYDNKEIITQDKEQVNNNETLIQDKEQDNNNMSIIEQVKEKSVNYADICPKCSGELIPKRGKYGKFLGCSAYPKCSFTRKIIST